MNYKTTIRKVTALVLIAIFSSSHFLDPFAAANASSKTADTLALRYSITDFGRNFLGTNYRRAGKDPNIGFDCSGFTHFIFRNFDVYLSPSSTQQATQGKKIPVSEVTTGDLIFFKRSPKGGRINHVAVVTENENGNIKIMHSTSRGVVEENLYRYAYWRNRVAHAKDVLGVM